MSKKIAIIGSGALATALGKVLHDGGHTDIIIYGVAEDEVSSLRDGMNTKYFHNSTKLPKFEATSNILEAVKDAAYVVLAVPSKVIDVVWAHVLGSLNSDVLVINGSKGFYPATQNFLQHGLVNAAKHNKHVRGVVSLIGPSHAEEIVKEIPTIVAAVNSNKKLIEEVQMLFSNDYFRVYGQTDVNGAEAGSAYKNVLAIGAGIVVGIGYGINTIAALLTRGMVEMRRFAKAMKGDPDTLIGLTGLGDLIVTATSDLSRNFTFGKQFAQEGQKALKSTATVEGIIALDFINKIGREKNLDLPIIYFLYDSIHNQVDVNLIKKQLWNRELKFE